MHLSKTEITSFCGNVLPLRLIGAGEYISEPIEWSCDSAIISITSFDYSEKDGFSDGVLLTLLNAGEAVVYAVFRNQTFSCKISVHECLHDTSRRELNYYAGDFHDHTWDVHKREEFLNRPAQGFPIGYINRIKNEGKLAFGVVSDHACLLNDREFFRGYADEDIAQPMELVVFPGSESEINALEKDRYGVTHKNSGEIVTVNASSYAHTYSWEDFYERYSDSPFAISVLAHPQIIGFSVKGIWNFCLHKNNTPRFQQMLKMVEMGDGSDRESNLINEYVYSLALDNGFRVSTTCSSDAHGDWGYNRFPGKTIIMASEHTKEAFYDAIINHRIYASSSGNVKVYYEVNSVTAPAELPLCNRYGFHVELSYFHEDSTTHPTKCQVISDYGKCVSEIMLSSDDTAFDFTVESETARYFYLRLIDPEGRKTWSVPVWTGREKDESDTELLKPVCKSEFTAVDLNTGVDASKAVNDDPFDPWISEQSTCSVLIDMKTKHSICGLGHYPRILTQQELKEKGLIPPQKLCEFPVQFRIYTGTSPEEMRLSADGIFRVFGGEEIIRFPEVDARYVRLDILSNAGRASERRAFFDTPVAIGELTVFQME